MDYCKLFSNNLLLVINKCTLLDVHVSYIQHGSFKLVFVCSLFMFTLKFFEIVIPAFYFVFLAVPLKNTSFF